MSLENLRNAYFADDDAPMSVRVGIPHRTGSLCEHAFESNYPAMVSSSAFWNAAAKEFKVPEATSLSEVDIALDSAGFTAMRLWKAKGRQPGMAGVYPWTCAQYLELVSRVRPAWWSAADMCCEPEIASSAEEIDWRVRGTATLLEHTLQTLARWHEQMMLDGWGAGAIANALPPPVPILQGWSADDYLRSLDLTLQVWQRWTPWLAMPALIGVGSVCRRDVEHTTHGLRAILRALHPHLPSSAKLHCFGIKGTMLAELSKLPWIASTDSMAYDYSSRMNACKTGVSNTMARRREAMTAWMDSAQHRLSTQRGLF